MSYARSPLKTLSQAIAATGLFMLTGSAVALAGECPAGKLQADSGHPWSSREPA